MRAQRDAKSLAGATFYADVPSLDERALEHPYGMKILEYIGQKSKSLCAPSVVNILAHLGINKDNGSSSIDPRSAVTALLMAGFIVANETRQKASGSEYSQIKLTAKGWDAIGQKPPLWM